MLSQETSHAQRVLSALNQQRAAGGFCDAMLNVGDGVVYLAHRNILACFSELFEDSRMQSIPCMEICLQDCPNDGLELLLNFVYTGELKLDPVNLEKVQHAATSLCVPEALALCQRYVESSSETVPVKRKRGRPKKAAANSSFSVKEEKAIEITKDEPSFCTAATAASTTTATTTSTITTTSNTISTTTRSGRKVRGPRRLVGENSTTDYTPPEKTIKSTRPIPVEKGRCDKVVGARSLFLPSSESEVTELQIDLSSNGVSPGNEDEDDGDFEGLNPDSEEEYVPIAQASPTAPSTSTTRRCKVQSKVVKKENGKAIRGDPNKDSVLCPTCNKTFRSKYYLKVHNRRHTGEKPFECQKCDKRYFRKENLLEHESRNCARAHTYSCPTCASTFSRKQELRLHIISHTGEMPYKCSSCPEQFMLKRDLTIHMIKSHGFPKPHACTECTKCFLTSTELRVHEAAKHRGEKPFVCEECGHRASSRNGLQMHIKAIHRNERPFVCSFCGHAFTQKTNLNMHLRVHTGERPYQCHLCGKTFRTQASLDKHHRTHTGERPFSCEFCEQRFTEKGPLVRHIASKHQEGRPHCCHICDKTFKAMEQLRVHLRRHKGMRKFECKDCGYKFTRQAHLRRHTLIHKRTENYNPRQRKLRNVIVQEEEKGQSESGVTVTSGASQVTEDKDLIPQTHAFQEAPNPTPISGPSLDPSNTVKVTIQTGEAVMEGIVSSQNQGHSQAAGDFMMSDVLQQTHLVTEGYESTMVVDSISESKT
ncbi:telomere zinc finger-associated protein isoform X2 [Lampris incognitus]|uniref:telomere zinc finger-associated protein isoform X2 n=1 Tax=Lampris incognitus TaxID=2546036 RepID=UPI0024B57B74|nr:telomere zinc finger-associated protein isoform X2 [Lampris incognitus]